MPVSLSIVIPVYNVAPYLVQCLDSVRTAIDVWVNASRQGGEKYALPVAEIICVDDGSTDGSGRILDEYFSNRKDDCYSVQIVHKVNAGVSVARNVGLDLSTGEWVMFIDSDDTWDKDLLLQLFAEIKANPGCDAVCFSAQYAGGCVGKFERVGCFSQGDMSGDDVLASSDRGVQNTMWVIWDKIFRLQVIRDVGLAFTPGIRIGEDSLFAQQFLSVARKVCLRPEIHGYNYFVRSASAINTVFTELPDRPLVALEQLLAWWRRFPKPGLQQVLLSSIRGALQLGAGDTYAPAVSQDGIKYLVNSKVYNGELVSFYVRHGCGMALYKFMVVYYFAPRYIKRKLLIWLRRRF